MEIEYKWTIEDDVLKDSFGKLGIDDKFFPVFKERALYRLNDIVSGELIPEDIDDSIETTSEYIIEYANQIKGGMSEVYAHAYAYAFNMGFQEVDCVIFAKAYECAIAHGQDKTEAFCFGDFCSEASNQGYWLNLEEFVERFHEDWQKDFYIDLVRQEYEQVHHSPMPESNYEILKGKLYE